MDEFDDEEDFFPTNYDLEDVFDNQIQPLLKTILNICSEHQIPVVTSFQYKNNDEEVMLCTSMVLPKDRSCSMLKTAAKVLTK